MTTTKDSKIIERIRKLFAMSNDTSSVHEAEIALRRCMSLMQKHGITEADLTTSDFGTDSSYSGTKLDTWRSQLAMGIAAFTNTIVKLVYCYDTGKQQKKIVYSGFDTDVQQAILLSDYLEQTMERCLARYKKESGNKGRSASNSFRLGFAGTLQDRLFAMSKEIESQSSVTSTGTSLVVCKKKMVEAEFGRQRVTKRAARVSDGGAMHEGQRQGSNVNLNRQVHSGNQARLTG